MDVTIGVTLRKAAENLANGDRVPLTLTAGSMRRTLYFNQLLSQVFPMNKSRPPFHLAVEARDIAEARVFYGGLLGCTEGRSADTWVERDTTRGGRVARPGLVVPARVEGLAAVAIKRGVDRSAGIEAEHLGNERIAQTIDSTYDHVAPRKVQPLKTAWKVIGAARVPVRS